MLAQGHSNQQIADGIHVSVKTVETYRTRVSEKLGLKGRAELYRFATESGMLDRGFGSVGRRGQIATPLSGLSPTNPPHPPFSLLTGCPRGGSLLVKHESSRE